MNNYKVEKDYAIVADRRDFNPDIEGKERSP